MVELLSCANLREPWTRTWHGAAVVELNVEGSRARIPHDLGIHGKLFAIDNVAGSFEGFGDGLG